MALPLVDMPEENHVLLVSFSSQGHINPMLRLGKRLLSKGLHVTLALTEVTRDRMLKSSTESAGASSVSGIGVVFFSDGLSLDYDRKANLDFYIETLGKYGPVNLSALIRDRYHGGKKLVCLIANPFVPWVADVASELGIPCALLWIQPYAIFAIYDSFYNKRNRFPTVDDPDVRVHLPGLPLMTTQDLPSFVLPTNPFNAFMKLFSGFFQHLEKFQWVLGNSFHELERDVVDSLSELCSLRPVGPLVPMALLSDEQGGQDVGVEMWKSEDSCIEWLDRQAPRSVVYVSFGSIVVLPAKQMESIAVALKNTKRPFLWVVKPPEKPPADGAGELPLGFTDEVTDQGRVVTWCPQIKVLSHPAIACFVTHCGWNSMLETICSGIPMIAYPQWSDQPTNAKLITDVFKIGLRLNKDEGGTITSDEIERCIEEVMVGARAEELRKTADELKRAAREAAGPGGSSDRAIQQFVDEVTGGDGDDSGEYGASKGNCHEDQIHDEKKVDVEEEGGEGDRLSLHMVMDDATEVGPPGRTPSID
ncbi:hypothetical protein SAY87_020946 [Trapa incisa]|uniref:Glycosyltransferase n=1 Tax=Trapa incisa TaxID=236973 RepID=A0AAN7PQP2_9MYRT|nr:hypothetical protein SAY87_020946 [Trapa incisa]